jgi:hypothetical protein
VAASLEHEDGPDPPRIERRRLISDPDRAAEDYIPIVIVAQHGDRDAFGDLYARFAPFVCAILLARVRPDAAANLAQES